MNTNDVLATPLQFLKGVGPRRAADLEHAGLVTVEDLLYRFPIRYEDRSRLQSIASLKPGQTASITGRILSCHLRSTRRPGFKIFDAAVDDGTGSIFVSWLNQPFLKDVFTRGQHVVLFGAVEMRGHGGLQLTNPQYEILDDEDRETIHTGRIVPVYEKRPAASRRRFSASWCTTRCSGCRPIFPIIFLKRFGCASICRRATRRSSPRIFRPPTCRSTRSTGSRRRRSGA